MGQSMIVVDVNFPAKDLARPFRLLRLTGTLQRGHGRPTRSVLLYSTVKVHHANAFHLIGILSGLATCAVDICLRS